MPKPFTLTTPCSNCPFRKDIPFYLAQGRAEEIAESLQRGDTFHCHKTLDYDEDGEGIIGGRSRICAGALATMENGRERNRMMQVGAALGLYDPSSLDPDAPVYDSLDEWVDETGKLLGDS